VKRYEFKVIDELYAKRSEFPKVALQTVLDQYGQDGWQVVSFSSNDDCSSFVALLQREVIASDGE